MNNRLKKFEEFNFNQNTLNYVITLSDKESAVTLKDQVNEIESELKEYTNDESVFLKDVMNDIDSPQFYNVFLYNCSPLIFANIMANYGKHLKGGDTNIVEVNIFDK